MKMNELYIEQTNRFCNANCKITAEDILAKAKQKQEEDKTCASPVHADTKSNKDTEITKKEFIKKAEKKANKTMFRLSPAVAACLIIFILTGTTALALSGNIGKFFGDAGMTVVAFNENTMKVFFRDILGDKVASELVGQGYVYEINQTQEDENFRIDVIAATGDKETSKLAVDVYLKDERLAAANERIYLVCYQTEPGEEVVKDPNGCRVIGAYGVKDESIDNLYHLLFDLGIPVETEYHFTTVITTFESDENQDLYMYDWVNTMERHPFWRFHSTDDLSFTFSVPEDAYGNILRTPLRDISYQGETYEYHLNAANYGYYNTRLEFYFDCPDATVPNDMDQQYRYQDYLFLDFRNMLLDTTLIVDGTEYKFDIQKDMYGMCWDPTGMRGVENRYYVDVYLPAIDYSEANNIAVRIGDETHFLKEGN